MVTAIELGASVSVSYPEVAWSQKQEHCGLEAVVAAPIRCVADCVVLVERRGIVVWARLTCGAESVDVCFSRHFLTRGGVWELHAPSATVSNGVLDLAPDANWRSHSGLSGVVEPGSNRRILGSWDGSLILPPGVADSTHGSLRVPQLGALHAVSAHWSVKQSAAKIVLPTGTGKTEVMIAATVLSGRLRTLVLVPSDSLRTQISDKFSRLGILRELGVVLPRADLPIIGKLFRAPETLEQVEALRGANVVVTTTQMLLGMDNPTLLAFLEWFGLVVFDEAHHVPAASWMRIKERIPTETRTLLLTATPYRNDGKKVPGELIYQFPLRMAQRQGYFTPISVRKVDESDPAIADEAIAAAAVATLRTDEESGWTHSLLARARTREHAEALHKIYERIAPDLNPVVLHSSIGVGARRNAIQGLRDGTNRAVICVDMLGEGFDLPALKIAAIHDLHRSLPITLQFIGRFTRSASVVGAATAVINLAEPMAHTAVAELFSEDADWNELVPDLSARAIKSEQDVEEFVARMRPRYTAEDRIFDLALIAPKTSLAMIRAERFQPDRFLKALSRHSRLHQSWISDDGDVGVFVTQDPTFPDWSLSKEAAGFEWNVCVLAYDPLLGVIYANATASALNLSRVARSVAGSNATLLSGEQMFRVFDGLYRAVLFNVGLYRRGSNVRFQMLAGMDIGEHVSAAIQTGSAKSNIFAQGYSEGKKVGVGASFKGRIWAMSNASIPDWIEWAKGMAAKVSDNAIATNSILRYALIPTEVTQKPSTAVFSCLPPDELIPGDYLGQRKISVEGFQNAFSQADLSIEFVESNETSVSIDVLVGPASPSRLSLTWSDGFAVRHVAGPRISVMSAQQQIGIDEFLTGNAPPLLLQDGSELVGKYHYSHPTPYPYVFNRESVLPLDWGETPIREESKWRQGVQRPRSVQGFMIDRLLLEANNFVVDDDDSGEAADVIVLTVREEAREVEAVLYHCKFSSGDVPAARVKDLYEVCGQAVRSSRLLHRIDGLLAHMVSRESRLAGRPTRFEKGSMAELRALQKQAHMYRLRLQVCVVQPGLSASALTPELSSILGAADGFLLEFTGRRLRVFGSS